MPAYPLPNAALLCPLFAMPSRDALTPPEQCILGAVL